MTESIMTIIITIHLPQPSTPMAGIGTCSSQMENWPGCRRNFPASGRPILTGSPSIWHLPAGSTRTMPPLSGAGQPKTAAGQPTARNRDYSVKAGQTF